MDVILIQHIDQLRECRCDPRTALVLNTLHTLLHNFLDDQCKVITGASLRNFIKIHENRYKWCLSVTGHKSDQLVLDRLDTTLDLILQSAFRYLLDDLIIKRLTASLTFLDYLVTDLLAADVYKRSQMGEREGLSAVLIAGYLCDDLCGNVTCGKEAVRLLNQCLADNRAVLEHILQIDQVTVMLTLCVVIGIMEMNDSLVVSLYDLLRKKNTHGQVLADLACHVITLGRVNSRVLIGVLLLGILINLVKKSKDAVVCGIGLAGKLSLVAIAHILLCNLITAHLHNAGLYHILNIFHIDSVGGFKGTGGNHISKRSDLVMTQPVKLGNLLIRFFNGVDDLRLIKNNFHAISFNDVCIDLSTHSFKSLHILCLNL